MSTKKQIEFMQSQLHELRKQTAERKKKLGWEGMTDEELVWLMNGAKEKYWPDGTYFKAPLPTVREVREKFQEEQGMVKKDLSELEKKMKSPSGWVSRSGEYFPVEFAEHDKFARDYLVKKYGEEKAEEYRKSEDGKLEFYEVLETKFKWCRVMAWPGVPTEFVLPKNLTHAQKQTLYKYCEFHVKKLPFEDPLFDD